MSSEKQIAANRRNARKSRGPKTPAGKTVSSRNALQHGLASISRHNPAVAPRIEGIARAICADTSNPSLFEQALIIGETTCVLGCVCAERIARMERLLDGTASPPPYAYSSRERQSQAGHQSGTKLDPTARRSRAHAPGHAPAPRHGRGCRD